MTRQALTVAVVGATGVVGRTMIQVLNEREFPVGELRLLASGRSAGRTVSIDGRAHEIVEATPRCLRRGRHRPVLGRRATSPRNSRRRRRQRGATVIDNSSAWRMDPVDPARREPGQPGRPRGPSRASSPTPIARRCSSCPVLMALRDTVGLERVIVDTYQAVSGTGADAIAEFEGQIRAHVCGRAEAGQRLPPPDRVQRAAAGRRVPRQRLHEGGVEGRQREPQDPPPAGAPGLVHGRARPRLRRALRGGPRRDARADHARAGTSAVRGRPGRRCPGRPVDLDLPAGDRAAGSDDIFVGRVRADPSIADGRGLAFWVVSDNLRKGAATNAVQIAEALVERGWVAGGSATSRRRAAGRAGGRQSARRGGPGDRRDPRRAPGGARGGRGPGPSLHPMPPPRDAHARPSPARAAPTPRSCSSVRAPGSTRTARAGRSSAAPATC